MLERKKLAMEEKEKEKQEALKQMLAVRTFDQL